MQQKKTAGRLNIKNQVFLEPGRRNELKFISIHEDDAGTAAYVGFDDVQQLRRFVVSSEFLNFSTNTVRLELERGITRETHDEIHPRRVSRRRRSRKISPVIDDIGLHAAKDKRKYTNKEQAQRDKRKETSAWHIF
jgi:hypothetical protein